MDKLMKEIKQFNEERDWDQFHSPENLAKSRKENENNNGFREYKI